MSEIIEFSPSPSLFGFGALSKLPAELKSRNFKRILIITDAGVAASGILQRVLDLLKGSFDSELFDAAPTEPHSSDIDKQKERFGADFDVILGLGGGSAMDFGKGLAIIMAHGGLLGDYVGEGLVPGPVTPIVCVPTTSGTGSQSTQTTVFTIGGVKLGCSSEYILPVFSIVDPELTMGVPASLTRNAGYDALMHSIESFISRPHKQIPERPILYQGGNPFSRALAFEAFRSIWISYRQAVSEGSDREAKAGMSIGSHLAGMAVRHSGMGGTVHALAASLAGLVDAPHGECLAACTHIGLSYNIEACEKDLAILETAIDGKDALRPARISAEHFIEKLQKLRDDLKFPSRPSELGLKKQEAGTFLKNTLVQTRRTTTNARPLGDDLLSFIERGI
jgi:alcohol dehydrogenase